MPQSRTERNAYMREYNHRPEVKAKRQEYHRRHYKPRPIIQKVCLDCGNLFDAKPAHRKYCSKCGDARQKENAESFFLICDARRKFATIATLHPGEASALLDDIEREEGPEFRELLLDGIPERTGVRPKSSTDDP